MKFVNWLLLLIVLFIVFCIGKIVYDTRSFVTETRLTVTQSMAPAEQNYRLCLKRKSGVVGVVSIYQMRDCTKETGFTE